MIRHHRYIPVISLLSVLFLMTVSCGRDISDSRIQNAPSSVDSKPMDQKQTPGEEDGISDGTSLEPAEISEDKEAFKDDSSGYVPIDGFFWVTEGRLRIRRTPDLDSEVLGHLEKLERVRGIRRMGVSELIDGFESHWYEVKTRGRVTGWVYGGYLTRDFTTLLTGSFFRIGEGDRSIAGERLYPNFPVYELTYKLSAKGSNLILSIYRKYGQDLFTVYQETDNGDGLFILDRFRFSISSIEGSLNLFIDAVPESREYQFPILPAGDVIGIITDNRFIFDETGRSDYLEAFNTPRTVSINEYLKDNTSILNQVTPYDGYDGIYFSVLNRNLANLESLLEYIKPKELYNTSNLMILAVENNGYEMIDLLLENGLSLNTWGSYFGEDTPLKTAIVRDDPEMVKYLLAHGADADFGEGTSPYHLALKSGNEEILSLLREYGVDERAEL